MTVGRRDPRWHYSGDYFVDIGGIEARMCIAYKNMGVGEASLLKFDCIDYISEAGLGKEVIFESLFRM
jgi:hypothetical protein